VFNALGRVKLTDRYAHRALEAATLLDDPVAVARILAQEGLIAFLTQGSVEASSALRRGVDAGDRAGDLRSWGTAAVCRVLSGMGYEGEVVLSSGLREECLAARALRPDLPCGLVTRRPSASDIAFCVRNALQSIHPDHRRLSLLRVRKVKSAGLMLIPYSVDDPETFFRLVDGGADGVFSNRAETLRAAWRARA